MIPTSTGISSAQKKKNSQFFSYSLEIKEQRKKKESVVVWSRNVYQQVYKKLLIAMFKISFFGNQKYSPLFLNR